MNGKTILTATGIVLGAILLGAIANAFVQTYYNFPQTATVSAPTAEFTLNTVAISNNTPIPWGTVIPGEVYTKTFAIKNTSPYTISATVTFPDLPAGWTETWGTGTYTIAVGATATQTLTLTVPSDAVQPDPWNTHVIIEPD